MRQDGVGNQGFMDDFRRFFLRGLGALVPTLLTIAILAWAYHLVDETVGVIINGGLMRLCRLISDQPASWFLDPDRVERDALKYGTKLNEWNERAEQLTVQYRVIQNYKVLRDAGPEQFDAKVIRRAREAKDAALWQIAFAKWRLSLLGFLIAILLVYFVGFFLASFIGRASWRAMEGLLHRIPLIRAIYPHVKQVTDFLLSERNVEFSGVVAVEYPRKGVWSLALSTGKPLKRVKEHVGSELVTVFVPSSPTPFTGYVVQLPAEDVIELNMTIDEGLRFTISGGVIKPDVVLPPWPDTGDQGETGRHLPDDKTAD
ncbi:MAG: DUF502 domain-containing protein [Phycisphaerae bacterium]